MPVVIAMQFREFQVMTRLGEYIPEMINTLDDLLFYSFTSKSTGRENRISRFQSSSIFSHDLFTGGDIE